MHPYGKIGCALCGGYTSVLPRKHGHPFTGHGHVAQTRGLAGFIIFEAS